MKIANADALLRFFRFLRAYTRRLGFATSVLDTRARREAVLKFHRFLPLSSTIPALVSLLPSFASAGRGRVEEERKRRIFEGRVLRWPEEFSD